MNECEQIHPLLWGYLQDRLSAKDRRLVARHLNLCASARKDLEGLMRGPKKQAPPLLDKPIPETWDFKILNWMFKTSSKPRPIKTVSVEKKSSRAVKLDISNERPDSTPSPLKYILGIFLFFVGLVLLTHFIQNPGDWKTFYSWTHRLGIGREKESPISNMVLDFRNFPHWEGTNAPVAKEQGDVILDSDHLDIYWNFLEPSVAEPKVDFNQSALVLFFAGEKPTVGYSVNLRRMETKPDSTVIWYEEIAPKSTLFTNDNVTRPWVLQLIPKPPKPVVFKKIDS
jgi:hypothetical protein